MTSERWIIFILALYSAYITGLHNWSANRYFKRVCREGELKAQLDRERMLRRLGAPWVENAPDNAPPGY